MGNKLFQQARDFVHIAKNAPPSEKDVAIQRAKNSLSSAFANSNFAEQRQLQSLQTELDDLH